ncbi:argininosuccinate synthase [Halobacteriales archaeon SW_7_71_33]|nr:MAG: argininosuccinate synthase [Halobacteriales archaeon SW_7_71_33]
MTPSTHTESVALAFSGGLDTTVCVPLLEQEYDYDEVIGVTVDVGQPDAELAEAAETAAALGMEHRVVDARSAFADHCLDAVRANATYQEYPLGTALARPVVAEAVRDVAAAEGCVALAHGCTGKGNDQLRFEAVWRDGDFEVVAPVRELGLTREWETAYAADHDLPVEGGNEGAWSIDTNLWSRSEDGYPVALDGEALDPVALVETLNEVAGAHGVGRTDTMEDRMLGLKVRENYEHPAATTLLTAHEALEGLVLTADERSFKRHVDQEWAETAYEGLLDAPLMDALEGFIEVTQSRVTGTVTVRFEGGKARVVGRESPYAAYAADAASFDTESVTGDIAQADATGVAKYHGFQSRLANAVTDAADEETGDPDDTTVVTDGGEQ